MKYGGLCTAELIDKCISRDAVAWAEFIARYSGLIVFAIQKALTQYSLRPHIREEDIKDIKQEIVAGLWIDNKLEEIRERDSIDYWLTVMARNASVNHMRSKKNEILIGEESYFDNLKKEDTARASVAPEGDLKAEIKDLYRGLSSREKLLFKLYFKKNLSLKEIAKIIRVPVGTASSIIARMRKKMKK
ncbi:MAG: sigma-70 family RNA polymerase sigma factor [Candidatus Omnitrophica bacterium]|nr:sigma-70 family RNA polymerase sigma factor [Candidatus Omnitrophota bacterium]